MDTYRDDLTAATARAEAAERRADEAEEKLKMKTALPVFKVKVQRTPSAFRRWWKENWGFATFLGILGGLVVFGVFAFVISIRQWDVVPYCYVVRKRCEHGPILCTEKYVIAAHHVWMNDDTLIKEAGEFSSKTEAASKAKVIGCPAVEGGN